MRLTCGNVLILEGMTSPSQTQIAPSEAADAFWRAMGGEAWAQWLERTGRISELPEPGEIGPRLRLVKE